MCSRRIAVLKFGSSVLRSPDDVARVAQEIYRWRRKGFQVVAVVSAIGNTTDRLTRFAESIDRHSDPYKFAALLATGERQSAALVALGLDRAGLTSAVCDEVRLGFLARGNPLDAEPVSLDCVALQEQLEMQGVVVVPGFIARDHNDNVCLLGRGGSDLTALFIAKKMGAVACRLIKDVEGLFEFDPNSAGEIKPRRFSQIGYDMALQLDENIVQHKGVKFAKRERLAFEVGTVFSDEVSLVGDFRNSEFGKSKTATKPVRVALLGLGTVGFGVWQRLTGTFPDIFEIVSVAVRDTRAAALAGVPESVITDDPLATINSKCDVVVELIGGTELTYQLVRHALETGRNVVTANKSLLAEFGNEFSRLSRERGVLIASSAAVGGAAHVLETVRELVRQGHRVHQIRGLLNGTSNFVLDRIAQGQSLSVAIDEARQAGLAEADPQRDLSGVDAAEKLVLIAREIGVQLKVDQIVCQSLDDRSVRDFVGSNQDRSGIAIRQVVTWNAIDSESVPSVRIEQVDSQDPLSGVCGAANRVLITIETGEVITVTGMGAGRWPTTSAVIADLIDIAKQQVGLIDESAPLDRELVSIG